MLWVVLLASQLLLGYSMSYFFLDGSFSVLFALVLAVPVGILFSSLIYFVASVFIGQNALHIAFHSLAVIAVSIIMLLKSRTTTRKLPNSAQIVAFTVFAPLSFVLINSLYSVSSMKFSKAINDDFFEDISLISSFSKGINSGFVDPFHIHHPICCKCFASSRWILPFHSSMLIASGSSLTIAFTLPHFLFVLSSLFLTFSFISELCHSFIMGSIGTFLFFMLGGFGFKNWIDQECRSNKTIDFVFKKCNSEASSYGHPLIHFLIGSRSSSASLSLCASAFFVILGKLDFKKCIFLGIIVGLLPSTQHQAFFAEFIFICLHLLYRAQIFNRDKKDTMVKGIRVFLLSAFGTGFFGVTNFPSHGMNNEVISFSAQRNPFSFWYSNLGAFPIVSIFAGALFPSKTSLSLYIPAIIDFVIGNLISFHSEKIFNSQYFTPVSMLALCGLLCMNVGKAINKRKIIEEKSLLAGIFTIFVLMHSLSAIAGMTNVIGGGLTVINGDEIAIAEFIDKNASKKDVIHVPWRMFNTVSVLTGRRAYYSNAYQMQNRNFWYPAIDIDNDLRSSPEGDAHRIITYILDEGGIFDQENFTKAWDLVFEDKKTKLYKRKSKHCCQ